MPAVVVAGIAAAAQVISVGQAIFLSVVSLYGQYRAKRLARRARAAASQTARNARARTFRQPITHHRLVYGQVLTGGPITFIHSTDDNRRMHVLVTLAAHPVEEIGEVYFNDELIELEVDGGASGRWAGAAFVWRGDGTPGGDAALHAALSAGVGDKWTAAHRQDGRAKIYVRFHYDQDLFRSGLPEIRAVVKGRRVFDPRTGLTGWTNNWALVVRDYLALPSDTGVGATDAELNDDAIIAAANIADEIVGVQPRAATVEAVRLGAPAPGFDLTPNPAGGTQYFYSITFVTASGETVGSHTVRAREVKTSGSIFTGGFASVTLQDIPTGPSNVTARKIYRTEGRGPLSWGTDVADSDYKLVTTLNDNTTTTFEDEVRDLDLGAAIPTSNTAEPTHLALEAGAYFRTGDALEFSTDGTLPGGLLAATTYHWISLGSRLGRVASSLSNARAGVAVALTDTGSGTHTATRTAEPRYTCDGVVFTEDPPREILEDLLTAGSGRLINSNGVWTLYAGAYRTPTITLDEDDLDGHPQVTTRLGRRQIFNGARGVCIQPEKQWQPDDFPPVVGGAVRQLLDAGPNGLDATVSGAAIVSGPSAASEALRFDGTDDFAEVAFDELFNFERTDAFTVVVRFRTADESDVVMFEKHDSAFDFRGYAVNVSGDGSEPAKLAGSIRSASDDEIQIRSVERVDDGEWKIGGWTYDGGSLASGMTMYLDGAPIAVTVIKDNLASTIQSSAPLRFGLRMGGAKAFGGDLAEVWTYKRELTAQEMADLAAGNAPAQGPDDFHWRAAGYLAEDGGERIWQDMELPYTLSRTAAQRIAKIQLEQARQQITVHWPAKLTAFQVPAADNIMLDYPRFGWSGKPFEVIDFEFAVRGEGDAPRLGIDLFLRETAPTVFDWANNEETTTDPAPDTDLPNPFAVTTPTLLTLESGTAHLFRRRDGTVFSRLYVPWQLHPDLFVRQGGHIEIQYRRTTDATWSKAGIVDGEETFAYILDVEDTQDYFARVRAVNNLGARSEWAVSEAHEVVGKTAPPSDATGLAFDGNFLTVDEIPDLDRRGIVVRYQPEAENDWNTATRAHDKGFLTDTRFDARDLVGGRTRLLVRWLDSSGNLSANAAGIVVDLRPPRPNVFTVTRQPDGTREFNWETDDPPEDLAGAKIRWFLGSTSDYSAMTPLHDGVLTAAPFESNQLAAGTYTFAIKNVDEARNESADATFIETTIGDPRIAGALEDVSEAPTWTGTKTDCHVDPGTGWLIADNQDGWADTTAFSAMGAWVSNPVGTIKYRRKIDIGTIATFVPLVSLAGDGTLSVLERHSDDDVNYTAFASLGQSITARYIEIEATATGTFPKLKSMRSILSADLVEELIEDLDISTLTGAQRIGTGDIRLPLTKTFSIIKKVDVTLQSTGGGWTWELIDKDTTDGPRIKIYDASTTLADATIDATVRGLTA